MDESVEVSITFTLDLEPGGFGSLGQIRASYDVCQLLDRLEALLGWRPAGLVDEHGDDATDDGERVELWWLVR